MLSHIHIHVDFSFWLLMFLNDIYLFTFIYVCVCLCTCACMYMPQCELRVRGQFVEVPFLFYHVGPVKLNMGHQDSFLCPLSAEVRSVLPRQAVCFFFFNFFFVVWELNQGYLHNRQAVYSWSMSPALG